MMTPEEKRREAERQDYIRFIAGMLEHANHRIVKICYEFVLHLVAGH